MNLYENVSSVILDVILKINFRERSGALSASELINIGGRCDYQLPRGEFCQHRLELKGCFDVLEESFMGELPAGH